MTATLRQRLALLVSVAGAMIVALDGTVLSVAQPSLRREFSAALPQIQWTSTGYLLAVAALLIVAGRLGDRYGHARLLLVGVLGFAAASAGIALAPGIGWVIALRVLQGVFGALLQPATLALLRLAYPADRLGTPVAIRTSAIGVAAAAGPVLGGVLVAHLGWRAVFVINVPVALVIAALTLAVRIPVPSPAGSPHTEPPHTQSAPTAPAAPAAPERLDLIGATLLAIALAALVHTLSGVPEHGWTAVPTLAGLLATGAAAAAFAVQERRTACPLVPPAVARSVPVTASMVLLLVIGGGMFGALFVMTFFFQEVLALDPTACGLRVLPLTVLMVLGAPLAGAALRRYGARRTATAGTALVVLGVAGLSRLGPASTWPATGAALAALGAGFATVMVTATGTVVGDAPPGYAGVVGGLKQTAMNVGPTLGIAVAAGTLPLETTAAQAASSVSSASSLTPSSAFVPAMGPALLVLAALAALGLLPARLLPPHPARRTDRGVRPSPSCGREEGPAQPVRPSPTVPPGPAPNGPVSVSADAPP
ncbi:MFS transporter [Streptomyces sp. MST-110588]|uniref:MFS transporter n=1 Tax=Streptomyces sp. MST-110588 TaxID=2833628 RepID=UPI001F5CA91A|nr:MFS transporter [Streptomyces sp. MST-110588]UNO38816.1 MFS transporter [Streptomyces sp. MST-110588]